MDKDLKDHRVSNVGLSGRRTFLLSLNIEQRLNPSKTTSLIQRWKLLQSKWCHVPTTSSTGGPHHQQVSGAAEDIKSRVDGLSPFHVFSTCHLTKQKHSVALPVISSNHRGISPTQKKAVHETPFPCLRKLPLHLQLPWSFSVFTKSNAWNWNPRIQTDFPVCSS